MARVIARVIAGVLGGFVAGIVAGVLGGPVAGGASAGAAVGVGITPRVAAVVAVPRLAGGPRWLFAGRAARVVGAVARATSVATLGVVWPPVWCRLGEGGG